MNNQPTHWNLFLQILHWLTVIFLSIQVWLAYLASDLPLGMEKLALLARHKSFGMLLLALTITRLIWRRFTVAPIGDASENIFQRRLARGNHCLLYILLLGIPLSGWLMSSARGFSVSVFGLFQLPDLIHKDDAIFGFLVLTHKYLFYGLLALVVVHISAALTHHLVKKNGVLLRMLPFMSKPGSK